MVFRDRMDAGRQLAEDLTALGVDVDLVLAIPRGGLPVGRVVADELGVDMDVAVACKIGAPGRPELGIGAAASDGSYWLNQSIIENRGVSDTFVELGIKREAINAREKLEFLRGSPELPDVEGERVLLVDDGVATGGTAFACLRQLRSMNPEELVFVAPVGPLDTVEKLRSEADELIVLETPERFGAVSGYYRDFSPVEDSELWRYLD